MKSNIGKETKETITEHFAQHVSSGKVEFYQQAGIDFVIGRREEIYIWDLDGKQLINCHSNGGVFNLGHHNPRVVEALWSSARLPTLPTAGPERVPSLPQRLRASRGIPMP